ncbi:MAG: tRNA dihydrouridine synthase DusB [Anaerolineales bacterium]|nr:tRNA dihydrouridine synthase DusB [Anaerolineales bacterium]
MLAEQRFVPTPEAAGPAFWVRDIAVYGRAVLSPMDGYSDLPFRLICRELGSAMSYTEFVNVDELRSRKLTGKAWTKLRYHPSERPMTFQIYGHDEDALVETAARLQDLPPGRAPDIIDLNMGCYVKSIAERGAGSGMLCQPDKIARVFTRLTQRLRLPVTGKIRLGWDEHNRNYRQVARILEDCGASLIAVHGRTKAQAYQGAADWDAIAEVKQAVQVPVIGNGDVRAVADIGRMRAHTGCDAVMIGRAAIGNPWIFAGLEREQVRPADKIKLMRQHLALNLDFYGGQTGLLLFRKHSAKYLRGLPGEEALRIPLLTCASVAEFDDLLGQATGAAAGEAARASALTTGHPA